MKTPRQYVAPFDAAKVLTVAEAELLVANVLLDAGDYKDRIINALFRLKNGEVEIAEQVLDSGSPLLPVAAKTRKPVLPTPDAGEKTDAAPTVDAVGGGEPTGEVAPAPRVVAGGQKLIEFDTPAVKATKRVPEVVLKAQRGGKNKIEALSSIDESSLTSVTATSPRKSKSVVAATDEPAAPPLGKAGLPPSGLGRTGPLAPGKFNGKPAPRRPIKR